MTPLARLAQSRERAGPRRSAPLACRTSFSWSLAKLRLASLVVVGLAAPAAVGLALMGPVGRWFCLMWLLGVAVLMHGLSRRAAAEGPVLSIDERGILDRRLMARSIAWQEIAAICAVDTDRADVVDLELRWPEVTLARTRWHVRTGAPCQRGYGVPAVTISMLLLEGSVRDLLDAVALYRPDLLHETNRTEAGRGGSNGCSRTEA